MTKRATEVRHVISAQKVYSGQPIVQARDILSDHMKSAKGTALEPDAGIIAHAIVALCAAEARGETCVSFDALCEDVIAQEQGRLLVPWCSEKLGAGQAGTMGVGVFAREPIVAGERLAVFGGRLVGGSFLEAAGHLERRFSLQVERDLYLVTVHPGLSDWINHSCRPNAGIRSRIALEAMRDIRVGEAVTFDYAMTESNRFDEFDCNCGAEGCRGRMSGDDWQRPDLQQRYREYISEYLRGRFGARPSTSIITSTKEVMSPKYTS